MSVDIQAVKNVCTFPVESTCVKVLKEEVKDEPPDEEMMYESDEAVYEVEKIVKKKEMKGQTQYLIKWKGFEKVKDFTWELEDDLDCSDMIKDFEAKRRNKSKMVCFMCGFNYSFESCVAGNIQSPYDFMCGECYTYAGKDTEEFEGKATPNKSDPLGLRDICKICGIEKMLPNNKKHNTAHHKVSSPALSVGNGLQLKKVWRTMCSITNQEMGYIFTANFALSRSKLRIVEVLEVTGS